MFATLNDVPAPIAEFYQEVVQSTPTGNFYTQYYYENGVRKAREVEYVRKSIKVVEKPRGEFVLWSKVDDLIRTGSEKRVVEKFIELALNTESWEFHDKYLEDETTIRVTTDVSGYYIHEAKRARDEGRYAPIESGGLVWDADPESYMNMTGSLESWDTLLVDPVMIESGLVHEDKMAWTMEDNSIELITKQQLTDVINAIRIRAGVLHAQYQQAKA